MCLPCKQYIFILFKCRAHKLLLIYINSIGKKYYEVCMWLYSYKPTKCICCRFVRCGVHLLSYILSLLFFFKIMFRLNRQRRPSQKTKPNTKLFISKLNMQKLWAKTVIQQLINLCVEVEPWHLSWCAVPTRIAFCL